MTSGAPPAPGPVPAETQGLSRWQDARNDHAVGGQAGEEIRVNLADLSREIGEITPGPVGPPHFALHRLGLDNRLALQCPVRMRRRYQGQA